MFGDLQRLLRESLEAFRTELNKREPEDQVAELLSAMRRELVAARASVSELAQARERAREELERERALLEQCERRRRLAEGIGDADTVRVAQEFAARHRERIHVLEQKVAATEAEWSLRSREAEELKHRYQAADANRRNLVAQLRRAEARERVRGVAEESADAFSEWARMEEAIEDRTARAEAAEELGSDSAPGPGRPSAAELEARLNELKRRMADNG